MLFEEYDLSTIYLRKCERTFLLADERRSKVSRKCTREFSSHFRVHHVRFVCTCRSHRDGLISDRIPQTHQYWLCESARANGNLLIFRSRNSPSRRKYKSIPVTITSRRERKWYRGKPRDDRYIATITISPRYHAPRIRDVPKLNVWVFLVHYEL